MVFKDKKVLIIGMAKSGIAAAKKLRELSADITLVDRADKPDLRKQAADLEDAGICIRLGPHTLSDLDGKDLLIVSPGVPSGNNLITEAKKRKIPVWSEIELAYQLIKAPIVGITGTNGKTTTTMLVGEIFDCAGRKNVVAGNIGSPLIGFSDVDKYSTLIVELSSFQLDNIVDFRPRVSVLLNITEDHLDWHPDFTDYVRAKSRLFLNQTKEDFAILNFDDPLVKQLAGSIKAKLVSFSKQSREEKGIYVDNGKIIADIDKKQEICSLDELNIVGEHNLENTMAAVAVALVSGIAADKIREAIRKFKGVAHRIEYVASVNGVEYYNDSKATNPDAAVRALRSFNVPVVLMAGGRNKGNSFRNLAAEIEKRAKAVVVFGEAADEIYSYIKDIGLDVSKARTVEEGVKKAHSLACSGDVVLFSPACASFDQFSSYSERGHTFRDVVMNVENSTNCCRTGNEQ